MVTTNKDYNGVIHFFVKFMKDTDPQAVIVSTSFPSPKEAKLFAHQVLERRLVTCCNIIPSVTSIYRWKGELLEEQECLVEMKTTQSRYSSLEELINEVHPYDLPMLVVTPITGSDKYITWIKEGIL